MAPCATARLSWTRSAPFRLIHSHRASVGPCQRLVSAPSADPSSRVSVLPDDRFTHDSDHGANVRNDGALPLAPTHLTLGGTGSISWMAYVTGAVRVGAEIGGMFAFSPNGNVLLALPILARAQYVLTFYPIEVPLSLGVGMNIVKYQDLATIDLLIKPGVSGLWIYDSKWSFGLNLAWWLDMQFAAAPNQDQSRTGNFLEVSFTALYHY